MQSYIAFAWSVSNQRAQDHAEHLQRLLLSTNSPVWRPLLRVNGFAVYCKEGHDAGFDTYFLADDSGVIIGRLFSSTAPIPTADPLRRSILGRGGRSLYDNCWGHYVAFVHDRHTDQSTVLRDCSGQMPCFHLNLNELHVFFADIRDVAGLRPRFTIDTAYIAAFIAYQPLHVRETGLREVTELLAGDSFTVTSAGTSHHGFWNPRAIITNRSICDYEQAKTALIETTEGVVGAWASRYERILLSLSGGLDSAIVLGCLIRLGLSEKVECFTHYTPDSSDDERAYARSAANTAGVPLRELRRVSDGALFAKALDSIPPDPRPDISKADRIVALDEINALADQLGCDTVWTGQGGDQLFLQAHHPYATADYLEDHSFPWQLGPVCYHSAMLSRQSVWAVLRQAVSYRLRRNKTPPPVLGGRGVRFLAASAPPVADRSYETPWRSGPEHVPPGKLDQLDVLTDLLNRHRPLLGLEHPYQQHPLISQPLIELSLRIPTYLLLRGGRQRALARHAFADRVPECIISREDKGGVSDHVRSLLRGSAASLRERLLDGELASMGILERRALEGILRNEETFTKDDLFPVFACITAELWLQHWRSGSVQAAAA